MDAWFVGAIVLFVGVIAWIMLPFVVEIVFWSRLLRRRPLVMMSRAHLFRVYLGGVQLAIVVGLGVILGFMPLVAVCVVPIVIVGFMLILRIVPPSFDVYNVRSDSAREWFLQALDAGDIAHEEREGRTFLPAFNTAVKVRTHKSLSCARMSFRGGDARGACASAAAALKESLAGKRFDGIPYFGLVMTLVPLVVVGFGVCAIVWVFLF